MPTLQDRAKSVLTYLASFIPVQRRTVLDLRAFPNSLAARLNVDRVHQILDEAESGDTEGLFGLYNDIVAHGTHLQGRLADRKDAVLGDTLSVQPVDKEDADDVAAADAIRAMLADFPADAWERAMGHALDSFLWPVALVEKTFRPAAASTDRKVKVSLRYALADLTIVPHVLLTFIDGRLQVRGTDSATGYPNAERFDPEPARYIVHRGHLLTAVPDNWGGPMRSLVFWWLLSTMSKDWWARFLDRYAMPFMVGKYNDGDDTARSVMARAFSLATKLGGLVITKETDVEIKQAAASDSGEAYKTFIELCNREISKLILGETLSSDAQATGMNSGNNEAHAKKRDEKRSADARRLSATLREQLFKQFLQINGIPGRPPKIVWGSVSTEEQDAMANTLGVLSDAGLEVADEALPIISERFGLPVQRRAALPAAPGVIPFAASVPRLKKKADELVDVIAGAGASDLAKAFPGELAPLRGIIQAADSPEVAVAGVLAFCSRFEPGKAARIMEEALLAMAANGAVAHSR